MLKQPERPKIVFLNKLMKFEGSEIGFSEVKSHENPLENATQDGMPQFSSVSLRKSGPRLPLQDAPKTLQDCPGLAHDVPKTPQDAPKTR